MGGCVLDISAHTLKTPWTMKQPCSHRDQSSCTDLPQSIRGKCPPVSLARSKGEKNPRNIRSTKSRSVLQALSLPWALQHQLIWSKVWTSRGRYHFSCDVSWPDTVNDGDPKHLLSKKRTTKGITWNVVRMSWNAFQNAWCRGIRPITFLSPFFTYLPYAETQGERNWSNKYN